MYAYLSETLVTDGSLTQPTLRTPLTKQGKPCAFTGKTELQKKQKNHQDNSCLNTMKRTPRANIITVLQRSNTRDSNEHFLHI